MPSYSEDFGYAVVDACMMGAPVIGSNVGSILEVIFGKHTVFEGGNVKDLVKKIKD